MTVLNHTPFPAMAFRQYNLRGAINGVVVARGTFRLVQNDALRIMETQDPLPLSDVYAGDPHRIPLVAQGVLVPFKPGTDITLLGSAYAVEAGTAASWLCGLKLGPVAKALRVHGPRRWEPAFDGSRLAGWRLSQPEPVAEVPLEWGRAYGGPLPRGPDEAETVCPRNPLGCGIVDLEKTAIGPGESRPAPQIEAPGAPIGAWDETPEPQGFGPVPPWWAQRLSLAGTFDEAWRDVRHPLLPADFDYRFYQCAPPGLVAEPWLSGDEAFQLVNLVPGPVRLHGRLPALRLRMRLEQTDGDVIRDLVLDGVEFDLRPQVAKVFLTWRAGFAWADGHGMPELALVRAPKTSEATT